MKPRTIKRSCLVLISLFNASLLAAPAGGDANPYLLIVQKNSFRLLPPIQSPIEVPRPTTKVALQGLTTATGRVQALVRLIAPGNGGEVSVILGEGERTAGIEITRIDPASRTVSVLNHGRWQLLFLEAQSMAPPAGMR